MVQVLYESTEFQEYAIRRIVCIPSNESPRLIAFEIKNFVGGQKFLSLMGDIDFNDEIYVYKLLWPKPNDKIIELLLLLDLLFQKSLKVKKLIIPFIPYLRQDREIDRNSSVGSRALGRILSGFDIEEIITYDAHSKNSINFFACKITNLNYNDYFIKEILKDEICGRKFDYKNSLVISPDEGGLFRAKALGERLGVEYRALIKERKGLEVITKGFDVSKTWDRIIIIDDIIDTGETILSCLDLVSCYAINISLCISHVLHEKPIEKIQEKYPKLEIIRP